MLVVGIVFSEMSSRAYKNKRGAWYCINGNNGGQSNLSCIRNAYGTRASSSCKWKDHPEAALSITIVSEFIIKASINLSKNDYEFLGVMILSTIPYFTASSAVIQ